MLLLTCKTYGFHNDVWLVVSWLTPPESLVHLDQKAHLWLPAILAGDLIKTEVTIWVLADVFANIKK